MIDSQLRTVGVSDGLVLAAILDTPREPFVPQPGLAYADAAVEVAPGRWLLEPMVLALLLQQARVARGERVLVVGAATGYSAAVLAALGARVTALESDPALVAGAKATGVATVTGPLVDGWAPAAPYDVILFEGAIAALPAAIAAQLAPAGRLAAVVRDAGVGGAQVGPLVTGPAGPRIGGQPFLEVAARLLPGFGRAPAFAF